MPHVLRDSTGDIIAVVDRECPGPTEEVAADDPDLLAFVGHNASDGVSDDTGALTDFSRADLEFIRVLEDLIGALITKGHLSLSDLPAEAQRKLLNRSAMRNRILSYELGEEDGEFLV